MATAKKDVEAKEVHESTVNIPDEVLHPENYPELEEVWAGGKKEADDVSGYRDPRQYFYGVGKGGVLEVQDDILDPDGYDAFLKHYYEEVVPPYIKGSLLNTYNIRFFRAVPQGDELPGPEYVVKVAGPRVFIRCTNYGELLHVIQLGVGKLY